MAILALVDVVNCGVTLDAGGNNARLIRYLLGGTPEIKNAWMEIFSFKNCLSDHQYNCIVWFCSTHNLKSLRNQLLASSNNCELELFFDAVAVPYLWQPVPPDLDDFHHPPKRSASLEGLTRIAVHGGNAFSTHKGVPFVRFFSAIATHDIRSIEPWVDTNAPKSWL